jgi:hypothetical protein
LLQAALAPANAELHHDAGQDAPDGGGGPAVGRPSSPRITAAAARGSEVWLWLSPPSGGGARVLRYEIEAISLAPAHVGGEANVPIRSQFRPTFILVNLTSANEHGVILNFH